MRYANKIYIKNVHWTQYFWAAVVINWYFHPIKSLKGKHIPSPSKKHIFFWIEHHLPKNMEDILCVCQESLSTCLSIVQWFVAWNLKFKTSCLKSKNQLSDSLKYLSDIKWFPNELKGECTQSWFCNNRKRVIDMIEWRATHHFKTRTLHFG